MTVLPGEISPSKCSHSITSLPVDIVAGVTFYFTVTTRDIYDNLIKTARANTSVEIKAVYEDHDAWLSPLPTVPDLPGWERIYGRDVAGLAVFNNESAADPDSVYSCQVTIYRAGTFSLELLVDGEPIMAAPLVSQLLVRPAEIYAPACIVDGLALEMVAGGTFTASIQARDFYSNNLKAGLAEAVQVWRAEIEYENPSDNYLIFVVAGSIADKSGGPPDYSGVFEVSFSPTFAGSTFRILLRLNGLDVDAAAAYRAQPLVVLPAPSSSAATCNYTILAEPGQAYTQFTDQVGSTSYEYEAGAFFRVLIDARDEFANLRFDSLGDVFEVRLTGQATAVVVSGPAAAMGNGSYVLGLQLTLAEPYDLSILLDGTAEILGAPLLNRILVVPSLTQAAYSLLVTTDSPLTAGVTYTFEIRAKDIFGNTVLGSQDLVGF